MEDWRDRAACRGMPGSLFFDDIWAPGVEQDGATVPEALERARRVCASCPVRVQCFEVAMAEEDGAARSRRHGVRAGLTPDQRYSVWRRDAVRCEQCLETYDPLGLVAGEVVCQCGSLDEPPIPDQGDEWYPRHDALLKRLVDYLLAETEPGDRILPPYRMLRAIGHRRKDDMPLCYQRLIEDGLIVRGPGRGEYYRAAGAQALRRWKPPARRHNPHGASEDSVSVRIRRPA